VDSRGCNLRSVQEILPTPAGSHKAGENGDATSHLITLCQRSPTAMAGRVPMVDDCKVKNLKVGTLGTCPSDWPTAKSSPRRRENSTRIWKNVTLRKNRNSGGAKILFFEKARFWVISAVLKNGAAGARPHACKHWEFSTFIIADPGLIARRPA